MHGDVEEEIEGTELAAEFTFSSLQKFGQEFLMKLRGKKMPNPLLKKVRIIFTHNKKKFVGLFLPCWAVKMNPDLNVESSF